MKEEKDTRESSSRQRAKTWIYRGLVVAIVLGGIVAYLGWWSHFRNFRPEFATAEPLCLREKTPSMTVFLWEEQLLVAPFDGVVHYPLGPVPSRVSKGEIVAEIISGPKRVAIQAPKSGYFVPGLDGLEGKWSFSGVWPGDGEIPQGRHLKWKKDGENVAGGRAIGKLVPQPQDLRAVAYIGADEAARRQIKSGAVLFSMNGERPQKARIRAVQDYGSKAKVYLTLPFFPLQAVSSRSGEVDFFHSGIEGVVVPESAVLQKDGGLGVFAFSSGKLQYRGVTGQPLPKSLFLVTGGLKAGDLVLGQASLGAERKVVLW